MDEIKNIIDELGIDSLENNIKIAGVAVVSDSGNLIFQTSNWDISNQTNVILEVIRGASSFVLSDFSYTVTQSATEGFIGINDSGMGYILIVPFQGGVLVAYAMPQADPPRALSFLKSYATRLNGKV
ncbi:MAG: hypothetical protein ACFFC3_14205 [Candidatus Odinarchaeota archaeon]